MVSDDINNYYYIMAGRLKGTSNVITLLTDEIDELFATTVVELLHT
jgi:hypothetical protein